MATGRIGVTPTLGVRWSKAPTGGTTALSGLDDSSVSLVYSVGYEQVYRNGVLLSRGNDYTATTGTTITLIDATITGDIIEVFAQQLVPLTDAISKGQFTAKGTLLSATAASTPGVLGVGTNGQLLSADSTASTGLAWTTVSSGGITLITETVASALSSLTFGSIPSTYKELLLVWDGLTCSDSTTRFEIRLNNNSSTVYYNRIFKFTAAGNVTTGSGDSLGANENATMAMVNTSPTAMEQRWAGTLRIYNYSSATKDKRYDYQTAGYNNSTGEARGGSLIGTFDSTTAISSIDIYRGNGTGTFSNATNTSIRLYGIS